MRTLLMLAAFGAFAVAHDDPCRPAPQRHLRSRWACAPARTSAWPKNPVQQRRFLNRLYTGRSYLDYRAYGCAPRRGVAIDCGATARPLWGRYAGCARPWIALGPLYSRLGASLTLDDPVFEREPAAVEAPAETRADGPPPGGERVGHRFVLREP